MRSTTLIAVGAAMITLFAAAPASAVTRLASAPNSSSARGSITVVADGYDNELHISESNVQQPRGRLGPMGGLVGAPGAEAVRQAYKGLQQQIGREVFRKTTYGPAAGALAVRWTVPLAVMLVLLTPSNADEDPETGPWVIVREKSTDPNTKIEPIWPCRYLRGGPYGKLAGCPTLGEEGAAVIPPNLNADLGGGDDVAFLDLDGFVVNQRTVWGGPGNDVIVGSGRDDELEGGDGEDTVFGNNGNDIIFGDETPWKSGATPALDDSNADTLSGGVGEDVILGLEGEDYIDGGSGNDRRKPWDVMGNRDWYDPEFIGEAALYGGSQRDVIVGGPGIDTMEGGLSPDTLQARETDFPPYSADERDEVINCDLSFPLPEDPHDRGKDYVRRSPIDPTPLSCDYELNRRIDVNDVNTWAWLRHGTWLEAKTPFPWESW